MNITEVITTVLAVLVALVSVALIPWIRGKVGEAKMDSFLRWVDIAVAAAEQLYSSDAWQTKKEYVEAFLTDHGVTYDESEVNNAIEAAVNRLHNELRGDKVC